MASNMRFVFGLLAGSAGAGTVLFAAQALAQETMGSQSQRSWVALDRCAVYGPDFTSVEGTQTCVKIGGHVRVEFGQRLPNQLNDRPAINDQGQVNNQGWGTAPAAMRSDEPAENQPTDFPGARHLRLRQDSAPTYDGSYLR